MDTIFLRTSIRNYEDRPVEEEKIQQLLKAAMAAPSAGNQQPWEFYVVKKKELIQELSTSSPYAGCAGKAPLLIVLCYRTSDILFPEYAQIDLSACAENLLLEAVELGLGAVWLGIAPMEERMESVKRMLDLPENLEAFAIIPCGYPMEEKKQQNRYDEKRIHIVE